MTIDQPVEFKVFIIITKRIYQLFSNLEQTHIEKELENGENGNVEVDVKRNSVAGHSFILAVTLKLLPSDDGEDEENVCCQCDYLESIVLKLLYLKEILHLCVDHGNRDPVIAPQEAAFGAELAKFLNLLLS